MKTLTVVGLGLDPARHLTLRGLECLQKAELILCFSEHIDYVQQLVAGTPVKDTLALYEDGALDTHNYGALLATIELAMLSRESVAVALDGHPSFGVSWIEWLKTNLGKAVRIEVVEGVSSLACMITGIERDPIEKGTLLVDVNRLLLFQYDLDPTIDLYIFNIGSTGCRETNYINPGPTNRLDMLRQYLIRYYPSSHSVQLLKVGKEKCLLWQGPLANLLEAVTMVDFSCTLFLPGRLPTSFSRSFLDVLLNSDS